MLRIVAGSHRGRRLTAPPGETTRPTAERVRQAVFDMLWHAPWAGRAVVEEARVLDAFSGTGALGLEALSRGATHATFIERDRAALAALHANVAACRADTRSRIIAGDALKPPAAAQPCTLVMLDPPYGQDFVPRALAALTAAGWIAPGALVVAELGREEALEAPGFEEVAMREHGAARVVFLRAG
ncbi:16S rRNA (guanine(966)-N(2))-methyltransferase RsmD [Falsiroseomonas stagni]|uniref:16S rRNA (Guanine966-N2)-methyltransferase n=1 Tax=Falsiroseomonas stagni DSM 19981 TaxID=1123062 RepID=A0A1I3Y282_9PROT|nr:16S rRNA (guanine(966)-N(2))-methyltransferase RsmD [Falsiroseomonas stagni]SFK25863.1 16S rRNA (guanine966-N2)-methyltransferase [Falsiroseomonas stagni DSM 19981]